MERVLTWIRENPQFAALGFGAAVLAIVTTVLATAMTRAGVSLRPLTWFLVFFGIVAGPQAVIHFLDGLVLRRAAQARPTTAEPAPTVVAAAAPGSSFAPVPWAIVFGPKADPQLITDAKRGLAAILDPAIEAKLSFNVDGESALAARFASPEAAAKALNTYGTFFAFSGAHGSDATGWTARRHAGQGEWVHVVSAGPELYAWTGATEQAVIAHRVRALGPIAPGSVAVTPRSVTVPSRSSETERVSNWLRSRTGLMIVFIGLNLVAAVGWFFKGSAWAARVEAARTALPASGEFLQRDLLALNQGDVPTEVTQRPDGTIEINWRYADARWFDLMRLHQMKRTQRLVLSFDETSHTVRVREYWSAFDAAADAKNLRLNWVNATGIQFFAVEQRRVLGVQLGPDGRPTGELSKAYSFDLQALKRPIIDAVTGAGWRWQPVVWSTPSSLRWLTE